MTDADRVAEIRARHDAATPGPWVAHTGRYDDLHFGDCGPAAGVRMSGRERGFFVPGFPPADAEFIAHAPADIGWLLAEVARRGERITELLAEIKAGDQCLDDIIEDRYRFLAAWELLRLCTVPDRDAVPCRRPVTVYGRCDLHQWWTPPTGQQ